ncbi:hypothetical protein HX776_17365 [Pseudomonas agarici]|uniref:hypothetical protein n=2 Tax=Pseudomonas agarici TaxID=46677 RepID=UPI0008AEA762|nr:hypothetical protein [Pseudomonas agarici]NWC10575.1 hypothetical protein [Pseudomonas agarici]SEL10394.1 hypothetical protein SAMN05216604_11141 [Pseudomonas agarici]
MDKRTYDKTFHLDNARKLLEEEESQQLRYASLELRFLLEAHVYERLLNGVDSLPKTIIEKWEPNKAMKMLSMFDQYADMDLRLTISNANGTEPLVINSPNIKNSLLTSYYNTLGSFLHLSQPTKAKDYKINKPKLNEIFLALERLTTGNLIIYGIPYENFECEACGKPILYTSHYVKNNKSILCQNDQCKNEHRILIEDGMIKLGSKIMAPCGKCGKDLEVFISRLEEGSKLKCAYCFTGYTASLVFRADEEGPVTAHP